MKQLMQKSLCLMLALMLSFCLISAAYASEALIGQKTKDGHTIVSVQYAYSETDTVYLYSEDGKTITATLASGTKLAVTDAQKNDLLFVQAGSTSGWINKADLLEQLPQMPLTPNGKINRVLFFENGGGGFYCEGENYRHTVSDSAVYSTVIIGFGFNCVILNEELVVGNTSAHF